MKISKKTVYALRAVFELARQHGGGPVTIAAIAEAQALPARFLENILYQLKLGGIVTSARGREGGYWLARPPDEVSVGDVLRLMEATVNVVECLGGNMRDDCPLRDNCVFLPMWSRAHRAMLAVYNGTSYGDLVREHSAGTSKKKTPGLAEFI